MRNIFKYLVISICCLSCAGEKPMEIRYTSLNDYYTDYVFNLKNDSKGLKEINAYVLREIQEQNRVVDSFKKAGYKPRITYEEMINKGSFSLQAADVTLYNPPNEWSLEAVNNEDVIIEYKVGEESFKVEEIKVGKKYGTIILDIKTTIIGNEGVLIVNTDVLNLDGLSQVLKKLKKINYHYNSINFKYFVKNKNNVDLLEVLFTDKGKHIKLNFF